MTNKPVYSIILVDDRLVYFDNAEDYEKNKHFDCRDIHSHAESEDGNGSI